MAKLELEYAYSISKELLIIYKNKKELVKVSHIKNIDIAKKVFKHFVDEVECYIDCFTNGETNYDKFEWMIEYAEDGY